MRRILNIVIAIWGVLMFSCTPEKMPEGKPNVPTPAVVTPSVSLGKSTLSFGSNSSSETVAVTANVEWDFQCSDSWVTASKGSASQLNVSVTANTSTSARNASISLRQQGNTAVLATLSVSQSGIDNEISVDRTSITFTADGGAENVIVTANFAWETIDKPSWITLSPSSGSNGSTSIVVTAIQNTGTSERSGTIKLGKGSISASIPVTQAAASQSGGTDGEYTVSGVKFKMIRVEGGTFTMGATSEQGSDAYSDEEPTHSVTLSSYSIGQTEVTQELWEAVMGSNPSSFKGSQRPVEQVSWDDCQTFITKLNSLTHQNFRLPTEAEWEYAARGGIKSKGYKYSGSNTLGDVAWYTVNSYDQGSSKQPYGPQNVAGMAPNELGLYDMSGNVWEWCQDWYGSYSSSSQTNPTGPSTGSNRVIRGGGWGSNAGYCRVSFRSYYTPDLRNSDLGLRLAL